MTHSHFFLLSKCRLNVWFERFVLNYHCRLGKGSHTAVVFQAANTITVFSLLSGYIITSHESSMCNIIVFLHLRQSVDNKTFLACKIFLQKVMLLDQVLLM